MKNLIFIVYMVLFTASLSAQPSGRGGGGGGGQRSSGPPPGMRPSSGASEKMWIEEMPDIPNLSLEQRADLGKVMLKEVEDVEKQMNKKHEYGKKLENRSSLSEKEVNKCLKEMDKVDEKIAEIREKSDKKVKKILTDEQYEAYLSRKNDFKIRRSSHQRGGNRDANRPRPDRQRPQRDGEPQDIPMPDMDFDMLPDM